jgi:hypothetical protein
LKPVRVGELDAANPVFAVVRRGGYRSPAASALLALLRASAPGEDATAR